MKTAPLTPLGSIKGDTWERIYDYTVDAVYGANVLTGGTASADSVFQGTYTADKAVNGDASGWISTLSAYPHWWKYDLGVGVTKTIGKVRFDGGFSTGARTKDFKVQGSNNDSDWTDIATFVYPNSYPANPIADNLYTFWFANTTAYRYYRFWFTSNWDVNPYQNLHLLTAHEKISGTNIPQTSLTISGLNGDVDEEYILESKVVNGYNGAIGVTIHPNNDTTSGNFGYQAVGGADTTASASRATNTGIAHGGGAASLGQVALSTVKIYAKSGFVRTVLSERTNGISGTTVGSIDKFGQSWNNTADNITSLVIAASQTGGIGVGSSFQLYRRTKRS